jgi:hypothetical protein
LNLNDIPTAAEKERWKMYAGSYPMLVCSSYVCTIL